MGGLTVLFPVVLTYFGVQQVLVWPLQSSVPALQLWIDFGLIPTLSRCIAAARGAGKSADLLRAQTGIVAADADGLPLRLSAGIGTPRRTNALTALLATRLVLVIGTAAIAGAV